MKRTYKTILILACIAATVICVLPVMSVHLVGGESCTLYVKGYNLMEFSAWGVIPLLAPLLLLMVLFGNRTREAKERIVLLLLTGNIVCYAHGFNAARTWLTSLDESLITYYPGMLLIPFTFVMVLLFLKFCERFIKSEVKKATFRMFDRTIIIGKM